MAQFDPSTLFVDPQLKRDLERVAVLRALPADAELMRPGDTITHIPIVVKGSLRILLQNSEGAERYLYHIFPGESCAMSLSCCRAQRISEVKAVAEEDSELLMIPIAYVDEWMRFPEWTKFISDMQSQRFGELLEALELTAFSKLDEQLWSYLVKRVQATGRNVLEVTHQQVADELGSPREVITRLLHQLQQRGRIALSRHSIRVNAAV